MMATMRTWTSASDRPQDAPRTKSTRTYPHAIVDPLFSPSTDLQIEDQVNQPTWDVLTGTDQNAAVEGVVLLKKTRT